jgi:hypothetical protein
MSRFSYIPLKFEELSKGLERELLIKSDTDDIYVLDDYKIPVSATNTLRGKVNELKADVTGLVDKSVSVLGEYQIEKEKLQKEGNNLDKLEDKLGNDLMKRINGLEDFSNYLEGYYEEVEESFNQLKKQIEDTVDNYYNSLEEIITDTNRRYEENLDIYNKFEENKHQYEQALDRVEQEIGDIKEELPKKLQSMGGGSGSFDGTIEASKEVVRQKTSWYRWLSNSSTIYPGNRIANSFNDGLQWGRFTQPPIKPEWFNARNPDGNPYNIEDFRGPSNDENRYLIRWEWDGPLMNTGFTSSTGYYNKYGRKVRCVYERRFSESIKEDIHIDI